MPRLRAIPLLFLLLLVSGCDSGRLAQLEKQNGELKTQLEKRNVALDYDLQAKCSKDADLWFRKGFAEDKDTILLTFHNHYNKAMNKCFIVVVNHFNEGPQTLHKSSWLNDVSLWDIYENSRYGSLLEEHSYGLGTTDEDSVVTCEAAGEKCTSLDQWSGLIRSYMND